MAVGPLGEVVASRQRVCVAAEVAVISGCCVASHGLGTTVSEWSSAAHPYLRSVDQAVETLLFACEYSLGLCTLSRKIPHTEETGHVSEVT